jgi:alanine-glyoxylate transaminase/serine-glyoxylate transaminase/serine-pyruvate transaminase
MGANTLGHLDPEFIEIMNGVGKLLRAIFRTQNRVTGAVSGTGTAAMEAALCNLIEPGDEVLVPVRATSPRAWRRWPSAWAAKSKSLSASGERSSARRDRGGAERDERAQSRRRVHAETSTGVLHPVHEYADIVHKYGALLVADCVTSLAGNPVLVDE